MLRCVVAMAMVLSPPAWAQTAAERVVAGRIDLVEGAVRLLDAAGAERPAAVSAAIYAGDTIVTGDDGELQASMEDGGYIGVRPDTRVSVVDYRAEGGADDRSIFSLLQGSFRSVTGWIGKYNTRNYEVRTPTVTIGVRGTDHEPKVIPEGSTLGEPGTYDKVNIGATYMDSPQGRVDIGANQSGFAPRDRAGRPRLLARVPAFFRATRNEARFQGRHEAVRQRVDQLREQRRRAFEERRRAAGRAPPTRHGGGMHPAVGPVNSVAPGTAPGERRRTLEQRRHEAVDRRHAAPPEAPRRAEKSLRDVRERDRREPVDGRGERRRRVQRD